MKAPTVIVLTLVAIACALAVRRLRKGGRCNGDGSCGHCCKGCEKKDRV
ncbi:MAG: hypothetical protein F083_265 [bacterium F083]|nr:MAG: hypothetical protein F083_265 [bacterium F083]